MVISRLARIALFVTAAIDAFAVAALAAAPRAPASERAACIAFSLFPLLCIAVPAFTVISPVPAISLGAAVATIHALAAWQLDASAVAAASLLAEGLAVGMLACGIASLALRLSASRGTAQLLGSLVPLALLAAPFFADPVIECPVLAGARPTLIAVLLDVNPFAGVSRAMGLDWLRQDSMYARSVIGGFYPYRYPDPFALAAVMGLLGSALWVAGAALGRRDAKRSHASAETAP